MSDPLVSIIVPCFNAAKWLSPTLESVLAQTWPRVEIIVVDDGSTDNSRDIARHYAGRKLRVIEAPHGGACAARNRGLAEAQGELIQFLDADDLLSADKVDAQVRLLRQSPSDSVATCRWIRFRKTLQSARLSDQPVFRDLDPLDFLLITSSAETMMHPGAWLTPRTIVDRAGSWDETLRSNPNDDGEFFSRVVLQSRGLRFSSAGISYYRVHAAGSLSLSRRRNAVSMQSRFRTVELITGRMLAVQDSERVRQACADLYQRLYCSIYPRYPELLARITARVAQLGGSRLQPAAGPVGAFLTTIIGWRGVAHLRRVLRG